MVDTLEHIHGRHILICDAEGPRVGNERDATALVETALNAGVRTIVVPTTRLSDAFFILSTGLAGAVVQKIVNYRLNVVVIGDLTGPLKRSAPLRDWVRESNRGDQLWFLDDLDALRTRLAEAR